MGFNHTNELKRTLENGDVAVGAGTINNDPVEIEILGGMGIDFIWVDFEHVGRSPYDADHLSHLARAADVADTELLCRVPTGDPPLVRKILDTGIRNITVPRIQTADDVRKVARTAMFKYVEDQDPDHGSAREVTPDDRGTRGASAARVTEHGGLEGFVSDINDQNVMIGAVIEDYEAVNNIDEIFQVPGVGYTVFGPYCMSISIGEPGQFNHPKIEEAKERFVEAAAEHDIPILQSVSGLQLEDVDYDELAPAKEAIERGPPFQMFQVQSGTPLIRRHVSQQLETIHGYADQ